MRNSRFIPTRWAQAEGAMKWPRGPALQPTLVPRPSSLVPLSASRAGFSLVELLCAILILGIGLAGLIQGIATALASSKEAELHTTAALLAAGKIEMLRGEGFLIRGIEEGEFDDNFPGYRWRETVKESSPEGLFEVRVAILSSDTGRVIYELDTLLFDPPLLSAFDDDSQRNDRRRNERERIRR